MNLNLIDSALEVPSHKNKKKSLK
eukprot:Gb_01762 [translate_table: standard]